MASSDFTASIHFKNLLNGGWETQAFKPFRAGVDKCVLFEGFPQTALLRYEPGASVPKHRHTGVETILVLAGEQSDEYGSYPTGSVVINPKGSEHSVWSDSGCVVLIQWESAVEFI